MRINIDLDSESDAEQIHKIAIALAVPGAAKMVTTREGKFTEEQVRDTLRGAAQGESAAQRTTSVPDEAAAVTKPKPKVKRTRKPKKEKPEPEVQKEDPAPVQITLDANDVVTAYVAAHKTPPLLAKLAARGIKRVLDLKGEELTAFLQELHDETPESING